MGWAGAGTGLRGREGEKPGGERRWAAAWAAVGEREELAQRLGLDFFIFENLFLFSFKTEMRNL